MLGFTSFHASCLSVWSTSQTLFFCLKTMKGPPKQPLSIMTIRLVFLHFLLFFPCRGLDLVGNQFDTFIQFDAVVSYHLHRTP